MYPDCYAYTVNNTKHYSDTEYYPHTVTNNCYFSNTKCYSYARWI